MTLKDGEPQPGSDRSQEVALNTTTGIWYWGLLEQAENNGGSVTINIPSENKQFVLTTADIKAAQERLHNKNK